METRLILGRISHRGEPLMSTTKIKLEAAVIATWALAKDKAKTNGDAAHPASTPKSESGDQPGEPPAT